MARNVNIERFDEAPQVFQRFLNLPVIVETPLGPIVGVLIGADMSEHGGVGSLLVRPFMGDRWFLVKVWSALKTARSST
jgi:hypothetical protein